MYGATLSWLCNGSSCFSVSDAGPIPRCPCGSGREHGAAWLPAWGWESHKGTGQGSVPRWLTSRGWSQLVEHSCKLFIQVILLVTSASVWGSRTVQTTRGPAFHCCGELSSAICSRLSWKVSRLHDCICCILHFIGHFPHRMVNRTEAVGGICLWRYFGIVFLCLIASLFFEKHGSTVKTKCMCSFTFCFTWSMWLGKTRFLLKPQGLSEEKFCIAQVVHELPSIFSSFSSWTIHDMCFGTLLWKLKTYLVSPLLCLFYFANHVYRKDIINGILQMELYSFEHSSTLKRNSTKNCTILLAIILIRLL